MRFQPMQSLDLNKRTIAETVANYEDIEIADLDMPAASEKLVYAQPVVKSADDTNESVDVADEIAQNESADGESDQDESEDESADDEATEDESEDDSADDEATENDVAEDDSSIEEASDTPATEQVEESASDEEQPEIEEAVDITAISSQPSLEGLVGVAALDSTIAHADSAPLLTTISNPIILPVLIAIIVTSSLFFFAIALIVAVKYRRQKLADKSNSGKPIDLEKGMKEVDGKHRDVDAFLPSKMRSEKYAGLPVEDSVVEEYPMLEERASRQAKE